MIKDVLLPDLKAMSKAIQKPLPEPQPVKESRIWDVLAIIGWGMVFAAFVWAI